jgi:hypothetical protein
MSSVNPAQLPEGPLSMSVLLAIEPAALRRLLKGGLRMGLPQEDCEQLLRSDLALDPSGPAAQQLLQALAQRGWFHWDEATGRWRTRLGQSGV